MMLTPADVQILEQARVARLATASVEGRPHCVPVCFALSRGGLWIALDEKPKKVEVGKLRRVRNILDNPQATLLVDHYQDDWSGLWFLMVEASAALVDLPGEERVVLEERYPQYREMRLEQALCLTPVHVVRWKSS